MAEPKEQRPPKPGFSPGGYLPRLWRADPEPTDETEPAPGKKKKKGGSDEAKAKDKGKKKKGKPADESSDGVKKGVLLEETPNLDTIEARRTARIIAGTVISLLLVLAIFTVVRLLTRSSDETGQKAEEKVVLVDPRLQRERNETEARSMIERAREVARNGNSELALSLLTRLSAAYPDTKAAVAAREAINRPGRKLSLFPDIKESPKPTGATSANVEQNLSRSQSAPAADPMQIPQPIATPAPSQAPSNPEAALAATSPQPIQPPTVSTPSQAATTPSRPLPAGYQARAGVGVHPSGWPQEIFGGRDGSMMVLVPGGTFIMGRDGGDPAEAPAHQVKVSTFYIDKHEVTNRQFEQFVKENGPRDERSRALTREGAGLSFSEDSPVVLVSAKDARDYADWVGKRLPTEAQWEMAARGTDHRPYPWGPLPPAWERHREPHQIDAVMSFPSDLSPYGAYDMAGNAMEWTREWFDSKYFSSFQGAIAEEPTGPSSPPASLQMTVKGGSKQWIVSAREGIKYESRLPFLGFRCALPVDGPESVFLPPPPLPRSQRKPGPPKKVVVPF